MGGYGSGRTGGRGDRLSRSGSAISHAEVFELGLLAVQGFPGAILPRKAISPRTLEGRYGSQAVYERLQMAGPLSRA